MIGVLIVLALVLLIGAVAAVADVAVGGHVDRALDFNQHADEALAVGNDEPIPYTITEHGAVKLARRWTTADDQAFHVWCER